MSATPEVKPGVTHTALRTALKCADATYVNEALSPHPNSVAIKNACIRENFHFDVRLCDAHICSAEAIKELVQNRLGEIDEETTLFLPNVLEGDEEAKGTEMGLEELEDGEGRIASPVAPIPTDRPHHLSQTSMTPETTTPPANLPLNIS